VVCVTTRLTRKSTVSGRRQHPAERQRSRVASVHCGVWV
jgi:hypothetical protein